MIKVIEIPMERPELVNQMLATQKREAESLALDNNCQIRVVDEETESRPKRVVWLVASKTTYRYNVYSRKTLNY